MNMKKVSVILGFMALASCGRTIQVAIAQGCCYTANRIVGGTKPVTCNAGPPVDVWIDTTVTPPVENVCGPANVWNPIGAGGASGATGNLPYFSTTSTLLGLGFYNVANPNTATETLTYQNTTATSGVTSFIIRGGAAQASGGNPYQFSVYDNAGVLDLGASPLGAFAANGIHLCDQNVLYPCPQLSAPGNNRMDLTLPASQALPDTAGRGDYYFNHGNITIASGSQYVIMAGNDSPPTIAPTGSAIVGVYNMNHIINQTIGTGLICGYCDNTTITAANGGYSALYVTNKGGQPVIQTIGTTDYWSDAGPLRALTLGDVAQNVLWRYDSGIGGWGARNGANSADVALRASNYYTSGNTSTPYITTTGVFVPSTSFLDAPVLMSTGTKFTFASNGCSASSTVGGAAAGTFVSGTTGTCSVTININGATGFVANNGYDCHATDLTTTADQISFTGSTTTTVGFSGATLIGDKISFSCTAN
jgi:hypothetical protein